MTASRVISSSKAIGMVSRRLGSTSESRSGAARSRAITSSSRRVRGIRAGSKVTIIERKPGAVSSTPSTGSFASACRSACTRKFRRRSTSISPYSTRI
ncbi:hypothetical protein CRM89_12640 [Nocardia sp. FDAARGOS_372]|nr:hypothetical protein CRM89_12640 [Nocardia sp. FDAARGOS_372]